MLPDELRREALAVPVDARSGSCSRSATATSRRARLTLAQGHVLVTGPPRSGKTTTLATIAQAASAARLPLFHVHVRPTPLGHAPFWGKVARGATDGAALLERVVQALPKLGKRVVVVVDDLDELADTEADTALTELLRLAREHPVTVIAAVDNTVARRQYSGAIPEMRKDGIAVLLNPDPDTDGDLVGVALPRRARGALPRGPRLPRPARQRRAGPGRPPRRLLSALRPRRKPIRVSGAGGPRTQTLGWPQTLGWTGADRTDRGSRRAVETRAGR